MPVQRYVRIAEPVAVIALLALCLVLIVRHAGQESAEAFEAALAPTTLAPDDGVPPERLKPEPARALMQTVQPAAAVIAAVAHDAAMSANVVAVAHEEASPKYLIKGGSFELAPNDPGGASAWYYLQHAEVVETADAPDGERAIRFENSLPGSHAQAQQHLVIDGRKIHAVHVATWVLLANVEPGQSLTAQPGVRLQFFDEDLASVGQEGIECGLGTQGWSQHEAQFNVPARARSALVIVGLLGGTGRAEFDQVEMTPVDINPSVLPALPSR